MTRELIERTVRDWVSGNPRLGARDLVRLASPGASGQARTPEEIADALIELAARLEIAETRVW
jgi:hypothetical protein